MARLSRLRTLSAFVALGLAAMLGGCVAYPAYPTYGYGYAPGYGGSYVALGGGGGWHDRGWHEHGWHEHGWHDGGWHDDGWHDGGWRR